MDINRVAEASRDKLATILRICQRINQERDLSSLLDVIARETTALLNADRATIFLLDREHNEIWSKVALGSDEVLRFDVRLGIAGSVAMSGETINSADAPNDSRFYAGIDGRSGYHTRNLLTVPLRTFEGELSGAFQVLNKADGPFNAEDEEILKALGAQVSIAIETVQLLDGLKLKTDALREENSQLRHDVERHFATSHIVGVSPKIQAVVRLIEQITSSSVNVLITGESGTGKELIAKAIHFSSVRSAKRFVALNCAALPEDLVESELFGIEKGVATGVEKRVGHFEAAHQGTLFLDEIGDLSLRSQAKILRALQEGVVEKLGSRKPIDVDVRVLAATNKDLPAEIKKGNFREDLYYRLKVVHIELPALREIAEDIPLLANHFLKRVSEASGRPGMQLHADALQRMTKYHWPGNVREIENEIQRLVAVVPRKGIRMPDLSPRIRDESQREPSSGGPRKLPDAVADLESTLIAEALSASGNNQVQAAEILGISRQGLINKMKRYDIKTT
jgi:Nif-specific regulatory protein